MRWHVDLCFNLNVGGYQSSLLAKMFNIIHVNLIFHMRFLQLIGSIRFLFIYFCKQCSMIIFNSLMATNKHSSMFPSFLHLHDILNIKIKFFLYSLHTRSKCRSNIWTLRRFNIINDFLC